MVQPRIRFRFCKYGHDMEKLGRDKENRCLECGRGRHMKYYKANSKKINTQGSHHKRLKRYGISVDFYDKLLSSQDGRCAICGKTQEENTLKRSLSIDHCHKTGRIRGLLCVSCNLVLGFAKDDSEILRKAMLYLG